MSTNSSPQPEPKAGQGPTRPSLFGQPANMAAPDAPLSVLAALDGTPAVPVASRRRAFPWIGVLALLLVASGAAWMLRSPAPAADDHPVAVAAAPALLPVVTESAAPASAASQALARVEDLPAPLMAAATAASAIGETPVPAASAVAAAASKPRARVAKEGKPAQLARAEPRPRAAANPAARPAAVAKAAAPAAAASSSGDADVDLIAALVQHLSRDTRGADLGIADLVARCKSLQGGEALRCQRRICENYWGRADACPRSNAPNEVAARP